MKDWITQIYLSVRNCTAPHQEIARVVDVVKTKNNTDASCYL